MQLWEATPLGNDFSDNCASDWGAVLPYVIAILGIHYFANGCAVRATWGRVATAPSTGRDSITVRLPSHYRLLGLHLFFFFATSPRRLWHSEPLSRLSAALYARHLYARHLHPALPELLPGLSCSGLAASAGSDGASKAASSAATGLARVPSRPSLPARADM